MGYALGNLFTDSESFDPPSTPAFELRFVPIHSLYVKSIVAAAVPSPFSQNPSGRGPPINGTPVIVKRVKCYVFFAFTGGTRATAASVVSRRKVNVSCRYR